MYAPVTSIPGPLFPRRRTLHPYSTQQVDLRGELTANVLTGEMIKTESFNSSVSVNKHYLNRYIFLALEALNSLIHQVGEN